MAALTKQAEAKLKEAEQQMKDGDKLCTKTLTRWKADWDSAAVLYEKAANAYKGAKALEQAKQAFKKASNAQYQNNIIYTAARHLETAAGIAKDQKLLEEAADLHAKASMMYRENGSGAPAAENLTKAAKTIEAVNIEKAMEYMKQACELYQLEDKEHYIGDTFKNAISLFMRSKKYSGALELLENQVQVFKKLNQLHDVHKNFLSQIVVYVYCDDLVAANKRYKEFIDFPGFSNSQECIAASELLDAYENRDQEKINAVTAKQLFNFLENQVTKVARSITVSDSLVSENTVSTNTRPSTTSTSTRTTTASNPTAAALFALPSPKTPKAQPANSNNTTASPPVEKAIGSSEEKKLVGQSEEPKVVGLSEEFRAVGLSEKPTTTTTTTTTTSTGTSEAPDRSKATPSPPPPSAPSADEEDDGEESLV